MNRTADHCATLVLTKMGLCAYATRLTRSASLRVYTPSELLVLEMRVKSAQLKIPNVYLTLFQLSK